MGAKKRDQARKAEKRSGGGGWLLFAGIVGVLVIALVVGLLYGGGEDDRIVEAGEPAPDFTLPSATGGELTLSEYRGKPVLLVFYRFYT